MMAIRQTNNHSIILPEENHARFQSTLSVHRHVFINNSLSDDVCASECRSAKEQKLGANGSFRNAGFDRLAGETSE
jgi:hypothetical protein